MGRALAPVFMIPLIYFSLRGYIRKRLWLSCLALFGIVKFNNLKGKSAFLGGNTRAYWLVDGKKWTCLKN